MNHWMQETNLEVETFVLKGTGVTSLEVFAEQHDELLVSITANPDEAARWWHWQKDKCFPGEGWISFKLDKAQIMPMSRWTNVGLFWRDLLDVLENYISTGEGEGNFSEETATFSLVKKGKISVFRLDENSYPVEPRSFLVALLGAARDFYLWGEEYIGGFDRVYAERIQALMDKMSGI